jgi:hypothetical protein
MTNKSNTAWSGWWDDELEQLVNQAMVVCGEEAMVDAIGHAIHDCVELVANRTEPLSASDLKTAVKAALRQLTRAH